MARRQTAAMRRDGSFDALDMAARGLELTGTANAADLPRVVDRLVNGLAGDVATIAWQMAGVTDAQGRPALAVTLEGVVTLECQRCLRPFAWPVAQRTLLLLARDDRELDSLDEHDEHEVIVADAPVDPQTLIEDELLLSLPFAPHCERSDCVTAGTEHGGGAGLKSLPGGSPFAALAALKSRPARKPKA